MSFDPETLKGLKNFNDDIYFNRNVTFYGKVNLDRVDISGDSVNFSKNIEFTGGDISVNKLNSTFIDAQNINAGVSTFTDIYIDGKLYDGDGEFGTSGQVLASDGTNLNWINTSDANVGSASNVGTNEDGTNVDQYVTFVAAKTGNNPIRVDDGIKYNPSTNRLKVGIASATTVEATTVNSAAVNSATVTSTTVSATTYIGLPPTPDTFPSGGIIMWSGSINDIPNGWLLCNGSNGTPNLTNRFIVGASSDSGTGVTFDATTGAVSGAYAPNQTGGSVAHQLTVDEMPAHAHSYQAPVAGRVTTGSNVDIRAQTPSTTGSAGGNKYHENRPPYYALAYIMKS